MWQVDIFPWLSTTKVQEEEITWQEEEKIMKDKRTK